MFAPPTIAVAAKFRHKSQRDHIAAFNGRYHAVGFKFNPHQFDTSSLRQTLRHGFDCFLEHGIQQNIRSTRVQGNGTKRARRGVINNRSGDAPRRGKQIIFNKVANTCGGQFAVALNQNSAAWRGRARHNIALLIAHRPTFF